MCLLYGSFATDRFAKTLRPEVRKIELHAHSPFDVRALRAFTLLVVERSPDVCISTLNDANLFARFGLLTRSRVRLIRREANDLSMKPWWHRALDLVLDWKTDAVIALSQDLRNSIMRTNPWMRNAIVVLPNAVHVPEAAMMDGSRIPVILTVGSLTAKKDHATLIRACGLLWARGVAFKLVVVGDGPVRRDLEALIEEQGLSTVTAFLGRIDHDLVRDQYKRASIFVLSSLVEGSPNVLLEAMAAGLPAVASDIPGVREVVDAESGILAMPRDAESFASALERLSGDGALRARMGTHGRKLVQTRFDPERRMETLEKIIYGTDTSRA
jgi:glycosyltransferase involved in cell wall biosynthesis